MSDQCLIDADLIVFVVWETTTKQRVYAVGWCYNMVQYIESNVCTGVVELFQCSREGYLGVYFLSWDATREISTKITLEWEQKQFVMKVHTLFYFLHVITNPRMTIKMTIFTHRPRVSLAWFSFCWWDHNRLLMMSQWPDNCDVIMWIVISNSLDIDFIHSDIHSRSCKKPQYYIQHCNHSHRT